MVAPSSLVAMCAFGNAISLAVITFAAWVFIVARIVNGCNFYGGLRDDVGHAIGDMINRQNWCAVKLEVAQSAVALLVMMMFNFIISGAAIWMRQVPYLVFFNLVISLPVQMGFGGFCFYVAAVATNTDQYVLRPDVATCLCGIVLGILCFVTPIIVYVSVIRCRKEVYQMDADREEENRQERRRFELAVRERTHEILAQQEMERQYRMMRGGRGGGGRGGGAIRGGGGRGGGGGGRGGAQQQQQQRGGGASVGAGGRGRGIGSSSTTANSTASMVSYNPPVAAQTSIQEARVESSSTAQEQQQTQKVASDTSASITIPSGNTETEYSAWSGDAGHTA